MKSHSSNIGAVIIPLFIFVVALIVELSILSKAKKEKKDKELKEMLEKPLETFGSTEASELAKKYETDEASVPNKSDNVETAVEKCIKCNSILEENSNFCSSCGEKVIK